MCVWFWWSWYRCSTYVVHIYRIHQSGPQLEPFVLSTPLRILEFATLLVLCYILEHFFSTLQFYSQCALTFWFLAYCLWFSLLLRFWCLYYLVIKCPPQPPCPVKKHILKIEAKKKTRKRWEEMIYLIKTSSSWRFPFWSIDYESSLQDKGQGFNPQPGN